MHILYSPILQDPMVTLEIGALLMTVCYMGRITLLGPTMLEKGNREAAHARLKHSKRKARSERATNRNTEYCCVGSMISSTKRILERQRVALR